jgi:hypothetical protein
MIQAHHVIPGDDSSLVPLCAECHSLKHPDLPRALFFSKRLQPYWYNKSAASLAKEINVHPRTVIRAATRLGILKGELSVEDEARIKSNIPKLQWGKEKVTKQPIAKPAPIPEVGTFKVTGLVIENGEVVAIAGDYDGPDPNFGKSVVEVLSQ